MQPTELLEQGRILRKQDRAEAIACFEESIQRAESSNDRITVANATAELAIELISTGQTAALQKAASLLESSTSLLSELPPSATLNRQRGYILYCQGWLGLMTSDYATALEKLQAAYQAYDQDPEGLCLVEGTLGEYYGALGDFQTALQHVEHALSLAKTDNAKGFRYKQLGQIYLQLDQHEQSKEYFEQSLDLAIETEDKYLRMQSFIGLAQVAIALQQWDTATMIIQEVLAEVEEPLDLQQTAYLYQNLAEAAMGLGQILDAQNYIEQEAIPRFERLQNQHGLALGNLTLARVLKSRLAMGIDEANAEAIEAVADQFLEAFMLFEQDGTPQDRAKTLYDLAGLYTLCNESRSKYQFQGKSVRSLESALTQLEKYGYSSGILAGQIESSLNELMGSFSF